MIRYIALLRGINISGKNKIKMSELKQGFESLGFMDVITFLNSGNIIFSVAEKSKSEISDKISVMINQKFALEIPLLIIGQEELKDILKQAPDWWGNGNKEVYDNLIFLLSPLTYEGFYNEIGELREEYEKAYHYNNVVFWSFDRKNYQKTNWWSKTAAADVGKAITVRTANTVKKAVNL